jgi:hypothetical protein
VFRPGTTISRFRNVGGDADERRRWKADRVSGDAARTDLVLPDWNLPRKDGPRVLNRILLAEA